MLGLGTHRSWGLEGCSSKHQSALPALRASSSKLIWSTGLGRNDSITPVHLEKAFVSQSSIHTWKKPLGMWVQYHRVRTEVMQTKLTFFPSQKVWLFGGLSQMCLKSGYVLHKICQKEWEMCMIMVPGSWGKSRDNSCFTDTSTCLSLRGYFLLLKWGWKWICTVLPILSVSLCCRGEEID